jgi:DNA-binding LacI/PurR family transcriptional regulator
LEAAQELGYKPNKYASALARRATGQILFVDCNKLAAHDRPNRGFYASLYKQSLEAVLTVVDQSSYHLVIDIDGAALPAEHDGVILYDVDHPDQLAGYSATETSLVYGHHLSGFSRGNRYGVDNYQGAWQAGRKLAALGHRNIAYVTGGIPSINSHVDRLHGFLAGLGLEDSAPPDGSVLGSRPDGLSIAIKPALPPAGSGAAADSLAQSADPVLPTCRVVEVELGPRGGRDAARRLIPDIEAGSLTAIGVVNDLTAFSLVTELLGQGIRIPQQVSVIGFDNLPILELLPLRLATLDLCLDQVYSLAARGLLELLTDHRETVKSSRQSSKPENPNSPAPHLVQPRFIPGDSIGPPLHPSKKRNQHD